MRRARLFKQAAPCGRDIRTGLVEEAHVRWPWPLINRQFLNPGNSRAEISDRHLTEVIGRHVLAHGRQGDISDLVLTNGAIKLHIRVVGVHDLTEGAGSEGEQATTEPPENVLELLHVNHPILPGAVLVEEDRQRPCFWKVRGNQALQVVQGLGRHEQDGQVDEVVGYFRSLQSTHQSRDSLVT